MLTAHTAPMLIPLKFTSQAEAKRQRIIQITIRLMQVYVHGMKQITKEAKKTIFLMTNL